MCSMAIDALSIRPRKSPTCTNTSITANATPATVMKKRSLSWIRVFVARSTTLLSSANETGDQHFDHQLRPAPERSPVHPRVAAFRDVERDHAVHARPHRLGDRLDVFVLGPKPLRRDGLAHDLFQKRVRVLLGVALLGTFRLHFGVWRHE